MTSNSNWTTSEHNCRNNVKTIIISSNCVSIPQQVQMASFPRTFSVQYAIICFMNHKNAYSAKSCSASFVSLNVFKTVCSKMIKSVRVAYLNKEQSRWTDRWKTSLTGWKSSARSSPALCKVSQSNTKSSSSTHEIVQQKLLNAHLVARKFSTQATS